MQKAVIHFPRCVVRQRRENRRPLEAALPESVENLACGLFVIWPLPSHVILPSQFISPCHMAVAEKSQRSVLQPKIATEISTRHKFIQKKILLAANN